MSTTTSLPATMKALVLPAKGQPLELKEVPMPQPDSGSAVVKVLSAVVAGDLNYMLSENSFFTHTTPYTPGNRVVGRVVAVGPDATTLTVGQLVFVDVFIRARDNPDVQALFGFFDGPTPAGKKWVADNWRNGSFAEYIKTPLENAVAINEDLLVQKFGYSFAQLLWLASAAVPYGGLRSINLQAGETVIIAPATGTFSGVAVSVAVAMGATVIAASRNLSALQKVQSYYPAGRVHVVQLTGDVETDTKNLSAFGPVDAFLDLSPAAAEKTTHVRSCINAVRQYGRISLMGVLQQDIAVPYAAAVFKNLTIRGSYMYERSDVQGLVKLAESGLLKLGKDIGVETADEFGLDQIEAAITLAQQKSGYGQLVTLKP